MEEEKAGAPDILIIEDDRDMVNTLSIVLESRNFNVRAAYNGKEGDRKIAEKAPDLIILDVMMSTDTEGFDLSYKLRNDPKYQNIPIVMVTGFPKKIVKEGPEKFQHLLGEVWPIMHFLEKPIDMDELLSVVENIFRGKRKV